MWCIKLRVPWNLSNSLNITHVNFLFCKNGSIFDLMAPGHALTLGPDSLANIFARFIHTSSIIRDNYTNYVPTMRFVNLKVLKL